VYSPEWGLRHCCGSIPYMIHVGMWRRATRWSSFDRQRSKPGAHGAFTWGVPDILLKHQLIRFKGLSGSRAGAG
jgi:hypothetical protein